jgi:ferredoxin hydrogenase
MARVKVDENSYSLQRIEERCINCGQCLATCQKQNNLDQDDCINCGACILTCPVGALQPKFNYKEVLANIHDEEKIVVVSTSPAVRVAIGDEFGYNPGEFLEKKMVGVLKKIGFDYVFDTTFGADLTIMEEASELIERLKSNKTPMFTSCCPSWVLNMEKYHPEDLGLLSSCKSPIGMQGAIIKNYFAKLKNLNKEDIVVVSLAPCVSKKSEIKREDDDNTDYVITTSELAMLIRELDIDFKNVKEANFDTILGKGSGGGVIFGGSGGVMTSALRTAYYMLNNENPPEEFFELTSLNESIPIKEATIDLKKFKIKVAVIYGIDNANKMYKELKKYQFVEVMTCPGGCVGGAGQTILPKNKQDIYVEERKKNLFLDDKKLTKRASYETEDIKNVYKNYLEYPLSSESMKILHTTYKKKER